MTQNIIPETGVGGAQSAAFSTQGVSDTAAVQVIGDTIQKGTQFVGQVKEEMAALGIVGDQNQAAPVVDDQGNLTTDPQFFNTLTKIKAGVNQGVISRGVQAQTLAQIAVQNAVAADPKNAERIRQEAARFFSAWNPGEGLLNQPKEDKSQFEMEQKGMVELGIWLQDNDIVGAPYKSMAYDPNNWDMMRNRATEIKQYADAIQRNKQNVELAKSGQTLDPNQEIVQVSDWVTANTGQLGATFLGELQLLNKDFDVTQLMRDGRLDPTLLMQLSEQDKLYAKEALVNTKRTLEVGFGNQFKVLSYNDYRGSTDVTLQLYEDILSNRYAAEIARNRVSYIKNNAADALLQNNPVGQVYAGANVAWGYQLQHGQWSSWSAGAQDAHIQAIKNVAEGQPITPGSFITLLNANSVPGALNKDGTPAPSVNGYESFKDYNDKVLGTDTEGDPDRQAEQFKTIQGMIKTMAQDDVPAFVVKDMASLLNAHKDGAVQDWLNANPELKDQYTDLVATAATNYLNKAASQTQRILQKYNDVESPLAEVVTLPTGEVKVIPIKGLARQDFTNARNLSKDINLLGISGVTNLFTELAGTEALDVFNNTVGAIDHPALSYGGERTSKQVREAQRETVVGGGAERGTPGNIDPELRETLRELGQEVGTPTATEPTDANIAEAFDLEATLPSGRTLAQSIAIMREKGMSNSQIIDTLDTLGVSRR